MASAKRIAILFLLSLSSMVLIVAAMNSICLRCMSTCTLRPFTIILLVLAGVRGSDVDVRAAEHRVCNRAGQVFAVIVSRQVHSVDGLASIVIKDLIDDGGELFTGHASYPPAPSGGGY